jgi:hypothetical protein
MLSFLDNIDRRYGVAMARQRDDDPLKGLETVVGVVVALMTAVTCAVLVGAAMGSGAIPGVDAEVCVASSATDSSGFRRVDGERTGPVGLAAGTTWRATEVQLCDPDPDAATRALGVAGLTLWTLAPLVFFGLLWRMLRRARREGIFTEQVPEALRRLGQLLLAWAALDLVVTGVVNGALLTRLTDELVFFSSAELPWLQVLLGIALLALARVMEQAVHMRRDVEATI